MGLVTIACHLVKEAKHPDLLGDSAESRAVVQQWLEYTVTKLNSCTKEDTNTILKVEILVFNGITVGLFFFFESASVELNASLWCTMYDYPRFDCRLLLSNNLQSCQC